MMSITADTRLCGHQPPHPGHGWGNKERTKHWCPGGPNSLPAALSSAPINIALEKFIITLHLKDPSRLSLKANRVLSGPAREALELFARRSADYSDQDGFDPAEVLGEKGQFAEVFRKVWKLKNSMWDGRELVGEQPREILMDLIGHALLAIEMIDRREANSP
jgi:hypothetical protein